MIKTNGISGEKKSNRFQIKGEIDSDADENSKEKVRSLKKIKSKKRSKIL